MNVVIEYPIYNLENQLLAPAGTEINADFLSELCDQREKTYPKALLLEHGTIHKDLVKQFQKPTYSVIFSDPKKIEAIFQIGSRVMLPLPLLHAIDFFKNNDLHTYQHMLMIFALSTLITEELGSEHDELEKRTMAATTPTHDIGKIAVPLPILLKKTPLTRAELSRLKHHTTAGHVLLRYYLQDNPSHSPHIARDHHELCNGTGYPCGIQQNNPLVEIVTVCDIYDALIADRPYRPISYDNRSALEELTLMARRGEIGWDPLRVLISYNRKDKPDYRDVEIPAEQRGSAPEGNLYGIIADDLPENH